jgi:hypothetical protein
MAELKALDNLTEADFAESDMEELVETWLATDCKVSLMRERTRSKKDLLKYYKYLSLEAKNEGNSDLSLWWELVDVDEMKAGTDEFLFLSWAHQQASTCKKDPILSPVDVLWITTSDYSRKYLVSFTKE